MTETRRQRLWLLGSTGVVAAAVVAIAIAVGNAGPATSGTTTGTPEGIAATRALLTGIPQRGLALGDPRAPVTVTEFADLQCPFCGESARNELPKLVARYVRPGRVRLVFRSLDFLGADSARGARMAGAAALQNRLWQFVDLVYRNQGEEHSGWLTDAYLRRVATGAGLDVRRAFAERGSVSVRALVVQAKAAATASGVDSTPTFVVTRPGRPAVAVTGGGGLSGPIDEALKGQ